MAADLLQPGINLPAANCLGDELSHANPGMALPGARE